MALLSSSKGTHSEAISGRPLSEEPAEKASVYENAMPADGTPRYPFASNGDAGTSRMQEQLLITYAVSRA
jgi:hypothetical protein